MHAVVKNTVKFQGLEKRGLGLRYIPPGGGGERNKFFYFFITEFDNVGLFQRKHVHLFKGTVSRVCLPPFFYESNL